MRDFSDLISTPITYLPLFVFDTYQSPSLPKLADILVDSNMWRVTVIHQAPPSLSDADRNAAQSSRPARARCPSSTQRRPADRRARSPTIRHRRNSSSTRSQRQPQQHANSDDRRSRSRSRRCTCRHRTCTLIPSADAEAMQKMLLVLQDLHQLFPAVLPADVCMPTIAVLPSSPPSQKLSQTSLNLPSSTLPTDGQHCVLIQLPKSPLKFLVPFPPARQNDASCRRHRHRHRQSLLSDSVVSSSSESAAAGQRPKRAPATDDSDGVSSSTA